MGRKNKSAKGSRTSSRVDRLVQKSIGDIWKNVTKYPSSVYFMVAVDPVELEIPDYFDVIKEPMDLGTVKSKAEKGEYASFGEFAHDMRLIFKNAYTYNTDESYPIVIAARELESSFNGLLKNAERMLKINTEKKDMAEVNSDAEFQSDEDEDEDDGDGDGDEPRKALLSLLPLLVFILLSPLFCLNETSLAAFSLSDNTCSNSLLKLLYVYNTPLVRGPLFFLSSVRAAFRAVVSASIFSLFSFSASLSGLGRDKTVGCWDALFQLPA